jgi:hypothetical protein
MTNRKKVLGKEKHASLFCSSSNDERKKKGFMRLKAEKRERIFRSKFLLSLLRYYNMAAWGIAMTGNS